MPFTHTVYFINRLAMTHRLLCHEKTHIKQMEREGDLMFLLKYNWYWITVGYEKNPYEIEARKAENV